MRLMCHLLQIMSGPFRAAVSDTKLKTPAGFFWQVISAKADFLGLKNDWAELYARNADHSPFFNWSWVNAWLEHLAGSHNLCTLLLKDKQQNIHVIVPLLDKNSSASGKNRDVAIFCGYGPDCSDHLGVLYREEHSDCIAELVYEGITTMLGSQDRIQLNAMSFGNDFLGALNTQFSAAGHHTRLADSDVCPTVALPDSWDSFLQQLSKNFRSQVKRNFNSISKNDDLTMRTVASSEAQYFAESLIRLNRDRMQNIGKESSLENASFRHFLMDAIQNMANQDLVWMDVVENDEQVVGAALNLVHGDSVYYYMGGFDERIKKLGPGNALFARVIQRAIAGQCKNYDFLRGAESYKYRWGAKDVVDRRLVVYPEGFVQGSQSRMKDASKELVRRMKRRLKRHLKRRS